MYTDGNNQLFPPVVDVDKLEGFMLDVNVDIVGSALVLSARFKLNVTDVNPANTLSDVANSLSTTLLQSSTDFNAFTSS